MKKMKRFNSLFLLAVVVFGLRDAFGITNAVNQVPLDGPTNSIVLTQEMFPALPQGGELGAFVCASVAGRTVPFDQMPVPAKKTIQSMAGRTIPASGLHEVNPVDLLDMVINTPLKPDYYSIGLCRRPSPRGKGAVIERSFDGGMLSCSITNVSDLVFSLVVVQAFDRMFCVDTQGNVAVRNQNDAEIKRDTVYVLTLRKGMDHDIDDNSKTREDHRKYSPKSE